ncbi:hypothetical protein NQ318_004116 [Aromia moschata]|uniref:Protein transport protein sec16 n=1 Tax=Aromia moschata TaxID=1265417 RepID=A0AAV8XIW3_9CUCU|nr:hypothetical protein NQ318_004116 [Aromia moschata]
MVPGQMEQAEGPSNAGGFGDEQPPPGLSRMVLGQTETVPNAQSNSLPLDEDARRVQLPGVYSPSPATEEGGERLESEFDQLSQHAPQPRSATIGADTPPALSNPIITQAPVGTNRSETIGGGDSTINNQDGGRTKLTSSSSSDNKVDKSRKGKVEKEAVEQSNRRDSIEGQTQENDISNITNSVRNLTVGENLTDGHGSNTSLPENPPRHSSRQESSDSDRALKKPSRGSRDKKSLERSKRDKEREREKYRYSPESYRDKRYDRRRYKDERRHFEDDTDYYSDKEKDRRAHNDREREYDRKYSSLRKEKDKDRRRRDPREYGRDRRGDYYYGGSRYDDDYENENRSRPSSRSDSMHETYREKVHEKDHRDRRHRDRERERDRYRRHRDPRDMYNPYQGFAYDPYNPYYQQYQYYENLRRTNPQAYAEWYRKYYQQAAGHASVLRRGRQGFCPFRQEFCQRRVGKRQNQFHNMYHFTISKIVTSIQGRVFIARRAYLTWEVTMEIRAHSISGHYGLDNSRSIKRETSFIIPYLRTDSSELIADDGPTTADLSFEMLKAELDGRGIRSTTAWVAQRLSPAKFATAHIKASIASGKLLKILPHYPMDGQNATVEVCSLQSLLIKDEEFIELSQFPGPLVRGVTHKKTIIEFCENKIRRAAYSQEVIDVESYILMWELLILLIRQNGMVVGTDIAELLLKNKPEVPARPSSVISSEMSMPLLKLVTTCTLEKAGSTQSVLKEEEVTNKFREFLLYGSGKEALEWAMKHGLWGHALFLASKLDKRTYANVMMRFANGLTLNDPLQTLYQLLSGKMPAAVTCVSDEKWGDWRPHLAMILSNSSHRPELNCKAIKTLGDTLKGRGSLYAAQFCYLMAEVGFGRHDDPNTRLTLLGADHSRPFPLFASNEAIHMTEIYEYACGLNEAAFIIPEFQIYKYLLATRLADRGLLEKSLHYLEKVSSYVVSNPTAVQPHFVDKVCTLADRLKFCDPAGLITHDSNTLTGYSGSQLEPDVTQSSYDTSVQDTWQHHYDQQYQQSITEQAWQPEVQQPTRIEYQQQENIQQNGKERFT